MFKNNTNLNVLLGLLSILILTNIGLYSIAKEKYLNYETKPHFYYNYYDFEEFNLYNKLLKLHNSMIDLSIGSKGDQLQELENNMDKIQTLTGSGVNSIQNSINELDNTITNQTIVINNIENGNPY
tara:strand:+ start:2060 stop:2437 length:378 start_codon:yes stop_codon:yes gene_type:complete